MCGIGGILGSTDGLNPDALLRSLRHRGPDQEGSASPSPGVWLAATRLAIWDLTASGDQPMATADGETTVVYNGEIYNAPELRALLGARGHRFRSRADTEVLLHGYLEWGDRVVERLEGMFAFALWDRRKRRLVLARDPLGIKPLWIARPGGRLVFASEVRALVAARAVPGSIDPEAVRSFLATGSVAEPDAIVRGVRALDPGSLLAIDDGDERGERATRYWSIPDGETALTAERAAAEVRERLGVSAEGSFAADVPVALLLSGGVDSAALALLHSTGHAQQVMTTFHLRKADRPARRAAELARALGSTHHEVTFEQMPETLLACVAAQDQPSVDGANVYLIARAIGEAGLKVAVTGLGADELFLGYPLHRTYVRARALQSRLGTALQPLGSGARIAARLVGGRGGWRLEKLVDVALAVGAHATYAAVRALFPSATLARLLPGSPSPAACDDRAGCSPAGEVSRFELRHYLLNQLLRDADVMSMAHGIELRVPMLDHRLVELVVRLAAAIKLRPSRRKPLLIEAVSELPRSFTRAPKEGFDLPLERWLLSSLRPRVEGRLRSNESATRVGIEPAAVEQVWERFVRDRSQASAHRVWALYALFEWADVHRASV